MPSIHEQALSIINERPSSPDDTIVTVERISDTLIDYAYLANSINCRPAFTLLLDKLSQLVGATPFLTNERRQEHIEDCRYFCGLDPTPTVIYTWEVTVSGKDPEDIERAAGWVHRGVSGNQNYTAREWNATITQTPLFRVKGQEPPEKQSEADDPDSGTGPA